MWVILRSSCYRTARNGQRRLRLLARRIAALVDPTDVLGARFVPGLLLSALVADDALILSTRSRRIAREGRAVVPGRSGVHVRVSQPLLAFPDQQLIAKHLADDLLGLRLGFFPEPAHDGLLPWRTARKPQCFRSK